MITFTLINLWSAVQRRRGSVNCRTEREGNSTGVDCIATLGLKH